MNINNMRNVVVKGNIATLEAQIVTWEIYADRTGESVTSIVAAIREHITALEALLT